MKFLLSSLAFLSCCLTAWAQTSLTVGPPRVYFVADAGVGQSQTVDVTNPSKDYTLELAVSLEDWKYSLYGDNLLHPPGTLPTSCSSWLSVSEPFFSLGPGETKQLNLNMQVPPHIQFNDSVPVHTAMLFVTQLNPKQGPDKDGANIRIALRSGIKIYHRFTARNNADIEVTNLRYHQQDSVGNFVEITYEVPGNIWVDGNFIVEFINQENGKKTKLEQQGFYCLPLDKRKHYIEIPADLEPGDYIASVIANYGEHDRIKVAELEFKHEHTTL